MDSADFELLLSTEILEKMLESKLRVAANPGFDRNMLESKLITTDWYITKKDFDRVKIPGGPKREFLI